MRKVFVAVILVGLFSLPLMAQDKVDVFGGYQYLHIGGGNTNGPTTGQSFNGFDANARFNFAKYAGIEGDFSGSYATVQGVSLKNYTYAGGPVIFLSNGTIKPFAHVLVGGIHLSGSQSGLSVSWNGYTIAAGGGVDVKVDRAIAVRLIQADWLYYNFSSTSAGGVPVPSFSGSNNVRIASGIVFRF